jgi:alpha-methylacyl-CoA racemase
VFLEGTRILDFTRLLPGPYATLRLAELGAEVVKVEDAHGGDPARSAGGHPHDEGVIFLANNRNKKSVAIDLKTKDGQQAAVRLAASADVVMEGFRPGVAERLGIGYEDIRKVNHGVIYCSLSGYGQNGPFRSTPGHDLNYMSVSGILSQWQDDRGRPVVPSLQMADQIGGIVAVEAVLSALVQRQRTGQGAQLDISITDALLGLLNTHALVQSTSGGEQGMQVLAGTTLCYNLYDTLDDRVVSLCALEEKFWETFCRAVGRVDLLSLALSPASVENQHYTALQALFKAHDLAYWENFSLRVHCCLQPVLTVSEALGSRFVKERQILQIVNDATGKSMSYVDTHAGGHGVQRPTSTWPPILGKDSGFSGIVRGQVEQSSTLE